MVIPLDQLRERLDGIDTQIMALLSERARVISTVAEVKRQNNLPIYVPEREAAIVARLRGMNPGPLSGEAIERIYRTILEEMRNFERQHAAS
jgi:chorismate mutase/prephenate dehydratase